MIKILILNYEFPPLGGGGGVAAKQIAKGFIKLGYGVDYVTTWFPGLKEEEVVDGINVHRVKVIGRKELPTATMSSLISFPFLAYKKTKELCEKNEYEFVNTHFAIPTGPLGVKIAKKFNIKHVLSIHGGDIWDPTKKNSPHRKWYFRKVVRDVMNKSDVVVAQSNNTRENAIKYYSPIKEIKVIPLPYEKTSFKKISRKKLGLDKDKIYLISIGRVVKRKGYDFLIRGLAELNNPNAHSLILSDGPEKQNLQNLAKSLNVSNQVHFLGLVDEQKKFQYLSNSDIYVLSSVHEGFGIVLQEAMQVGLPIIATNNGGQTDVIDEGENGFLMNYGDTKKMKEMIERILKDKKLRNNMVKENMKKVNEFGLGEIAERYLGVGLR
jgi:glycosyltransferase involved in cell wall biosynthesis